MSADVRVARVRTLLLAAGLGDATCAVAGHDDSIAAIGNVAADRVRELAALAPAIRATGFRYVTLELPGTEP